MSSWLCDLTYSEEADGRSTVNIPSNCTCGHICHKIDWIETSVQKYSRTSIMQMWKWIWLHHVFCTKAKFACRGHRCIRPSGRGIHSSWVLA